MVENIHVQVKDNSPSIENILRPLSYTSWLMGVGVAHPRKFPKAVTTIIRVIHLVMCFIHMAYGSITFLIIDINVDFGYEKIYMFMHYMNWTISYVSTYYYIYHGIRKYDKWPELMDRMKKLDQKIRREIPMNDQPIKNAEAIAILAAYACCPLFPIVHTVFCYLTHSEDMFAYKWFFYYMLAQSLVNSFVFDVIVYVIYYRFQTINKVIEQLDALSDASWIVHKIRQIRELHNNICVIVITVNNIHGIHLLFCSANCFFMIVTTLIRIHWIHLEWEDVTLVFEITKHIYCILYVAQFGLICWICTLAREESERTGQIIYAFLLKCKHVDGNFIRNEVNDFSIQLQQNRVVFTACNFFEINNNLFSRVSIIYSFHYNLRKISFRIANNIYLSS